MIICIWNLVGKTVSFESTPRSENGAKSQVMRGLEFIFMNLIHMFKWRSHSPGSMINMSNKRASALNKVLRGNLAFIIFCYTATIIWLLLFLKNVSKNSSYITFCHSCVNLCGGFCWDHHFLIYTDGKAVFLLFCYERRENYYSRSISIQLPWAWDEHACT